MWQPGVKSTYGNASEVTSYISGLQGPLRLKYPHDMAEKELITSLAEVVCPVCDNYSIFSPQGSPSYNAYEKDIALVNIYFGDSTVFGEQRYLNVCS